MGRNPLYADLPIGTVITEAMRFQRLRDPARWKDRKFSCHVCGERLEWAGTKLNDGLVTQYFYCASCNANVEYTVLEE